MNLSKKLYLLFLLFTLNIFSQEKFTISGTVYDEVSNETLIGASIYMPGLSLGTTTNEYGFYSITLPKGEHKIQVTYLGYVAFVETINILEKLTKNFKLREETESLEEIFIKSDIEKLNIRTPQMSVNVLKSATIKQIPVVLGEADIIKSLILLPGVTSAGEGASGFNVRGGAADQNLMLLDEAIVFNSSHLFGFFSIFNPDAIKDIRLYKGGIPAKYGGRLSSVLDVYQKEGNNKKFGATGGIGLLSSRLLIEGPIKKEKHSFLVGGRSSYAHLLVPSTGEGVADNSIYFYDLNTKVNFNINNNNNIYFSGYFGKDVLKLGNSIENSYGNVVGNLRWNHLFSNKLFSNLSLIYSDYFYNLTLDFIGFKWNSGILNFNLKYDFNHYISNKIKLSYGINNIYSKFNPGEIKPNRKSSGIVANKLIDKYANEFATYIDAEHSITNNFRLRYGLRYSNFLRLGQSELNTYNNDKAVIYNKEFKKYESAEATGTKTFKRSDIIKSFDNFEPRVSLSYVFKDNNTSIKVSYNRMTQYLHLLSNTSSPAPLDVWTPSGKYIKPQLLDQYALGYFKSLKEGRYSLETEVFYKDIKNRIDYINGADLIANDEIETVILNGKSRAYGLEILIKKNKGKLKGWFAYTLSKSEQLTEGRTPDEPGINNGNWYSTPFDKTHDISINVNYKLNKKWSFNFNFIFQTGQPTNYPVGKYEWQYENKDNPGLSIPIYDDNRRNADRLSSYHRLDISATLTPRKNKNRKWKAEWIFGIYNIYNRQNAASITFRRNADTNKNEAVQTSIFGIVPSVVYNFKF